MHDLIPLIEHYGLPFVFLNVLLEQGGIPVPAYPTLLVAAALAANSGYRPYQIIAVAVMAALIADLLWYRTGRRIGFRVLGTLCRVSLSPDYCVRRTRSLFTRFGPASLMFAKLVPGFGLLATAISGASRTSLRTFVLFDLIGALLWSGLAVFLGVTFHAAIGDVLTVLSNLGEWGLILIVAALACYMLVKWWRRRRFLQQLRMDRISVDDLNASISAGQSPIILDTRPALHRADGGVIPGALAVDMDDIESSVDIALRDIEVVVYCACPNEASAALVARKLLKNGFRKVRPLHGGIDAWIAAGYALAMESRAAEAAMAPEIPSTARELSP